MTREEKVNLLNELLEIDEKNDIGNLTTAERREFQQWTHKPCINCEDGCEEWAGCPCVYYKEESEDKE